MDTFIFASGLVTGAAIVFFFSGYSRRARPVVPQNLGCSKAIPHVCRCVLPHGHEVRIHECEHGNRYVQPGAEYDVVSEN